MGDPWNINSNLLATHGRPNPWDLPWHSHGSPIGEPWANHVQLRASNNQAHEQPMNYSWAIHELVLSTPQNNNALRCFINSSCLSPNT